MNTYRATMTSAAAVLLAAATSEASARFADTPWQLFELPRLHTNQDGMIKGGATLPEDEWATIGWNDHTSAKPKPSLLDVTLILQSPTEPKGWGMNPYDQGLRIDEQSAGAPVWSPGGMPVPAPGALVMLGLAGLCGGRRRR